MTSFGDSFLSASCCGATSAGDDCFPRTTSLFSRLDVVVQGPLPRSKCAGILDRLVSAETGCTRAPAAAPSQLTRPNRRARPHEPPDPFQGGYGLRRSP